MNDKNKSSTLKQNKTAQGGRLPKIFSQSGFSLIEMAITLVIFGLFLTLVSYLLFGMSDKVSGSQAAKTQDSSLISVNYNDGGQATLKKSLLFFIKNNSRLPCPDVDADGLEDCAAANEVGSLPYLDLGYSSPLLDSRNNNVLYAVYRNLANNADLTANINRFTPTFPATDRSLPTTPADDPQTYTAVTPPATANIIDFCKALENGWSTGANNPAYAHSVGDVNNAAYILAVGGQNNADNLGSFFDGINNTGLGFENANRLETGTYDDLVSTESFLNLYQQLNCVTRLGEVNAAALDAQVAEAAAEAASTSVGNAEGALSDAKITVNDAIFSVTLTSIAILTATFHTFAAATELAELSVLAVANLVIAVAALASAIAALVIASLRLDRANQGVTDAQADLDAYNAKLVIADTFAKERLDYATTVELNGGLK